MDYEEPSTPPTGSTRSRNSEFTSSSVVYACATSTSSENSQHEDNKLGANATLVR